MGDPKNPKTPSLSLPPGCRFFPSDEQLLRHYLTNKNDANTDPCVSGVDCNTCFGFDVIKEVDFYTYDPFDLPGTACFRFGRGGGRRHWYCYVAAASVLKRGRRRAGGGYWKRRGVREVVSGGGKMVLGTRSSFVFYLGDSSRNAVETDWIMYEYALVDRPKVSFVLCRVFVKSRGGNNTSDHILSSCGDESVATVRHIGVQHDEVILYHLGEAKSGEDNSIDKNQVINEPVSSAGGTHNPLRVQPIEPVRSAGLTSGSTLLANNVAAQQLIAILEEDYIELNDLLWPL